MTTELPPGLWTCFNCGWLEGGLADVTARVVVAGRVCLKPFCSLECLEKIKAKGFEVLPAALLTPGNR